MGNMGKRKMEKWEKNKTLKKSAQKHMASAPKHTWYFSCTFTVDDTSIPVTPTPTVTWHETLFSLCHLATSSSHPVQGQVWDQCFFCLVHILWSFVTRSALVPLKTVVIPETVLTFLLLRPTVLSTRVPCSVSVKQIWTTLSTLHKCNIHILVKLSRSHLQ